MSKNRILANRYYKIAQFFHIVFALSTLFLLFSGAAGLAFFSIPLACLIGHLFYLWKYIDYSGSAINEDLEADRERRKQEFLSN